MSKSDIKAGRASVELLLKDDRFRKGLAAAKAKLATFAKGVAMAGAAMATAGAAVAVAGVRAFMSMGDQLDKMSQRLGTTVADLSQLKHAAEQSGASIEDVERALRFAQKNGIAATEFDKLAADLAAIEDPTLRAREAMRLFGEKSGPKLLPMLGNLQELRAEADRLGLTMSTKAAQGAAMLGDAFAIIFKQLKAGFFEVGGAVAPLLQSVLPAFQTMGSGIIDIIKTISANVQTAFGAINATIGIAMDAASGTVGIAWQSMADITRQALEWWQSSVVSTLKYVSFSFREWQNIVALAMAMGAEAIIGFGLDVAHFFTQVIPAHLQWLGAAWKTTFDNVVNYVKSFATEVGLNLHTLWNSINNFMRGGGWSFEWTNLQDAAVNAISDLPQVAGREMSAVEMALKQQIANLQRELAQAWGDHSADFDRRIEEFRAGGGQEAGDQAAGAFDAMAGFNANKAKREVFVAFSAAAAVARGQGEGVDAQAARDKARDAKLDRIREAILDGGALA